MNRSFLLCFFLFLAINTITAQVKIGSAGTPNSNAVLELDGSTGKGLLLPRLNNTQITALTSAPDGLIVYNITDGFLYVRKNAAWQKITDATNAGGGGLTLPYSGTHTAAGAAFWVTSSGSGDAVRGYANSGDGVTGMSVSGNGGYFKSTSGNALITLDGNVGIGTGDPFFKLDINGRVRLRSNGPNNSAGIWFDKIYSSDVQNCFLGTFNDSTLGIYAGNTWKFFFDHTNNNLGINNASPKAPLSLSNASGNKLDIYYASANSRYGIGLQAALMQLYSGSAGDDIAFGYGSSTSFTENMRIKGNGNVGIGISDPSLKFQVNQNSAAFAAGINQAGTGGGLTVISHGAPSALFVSNDGVGAAMGTIGKVGINTNSPGFMLDVNGRMRLRNESAGVSAGLWLDGTAAATIGFMGTNTNNTIGLYGNGGAGWGLLLNTDNGNVSIGTGAAANSKLQVAGGVSLPYTSVTDLDYNVTDNDYSIHIVLTNGFGIERAVTLPGAANRRGRIYMISAEIPISGTSSATRSKVTVIDGSNGSNVIAGSYIGQAIGPANYLGNSHAVYNISPYNRHLFTKQTSITVQSDGTKWVVINNDFTSFDLDDYYD